MSVGRDQQKQTVSIMFRSHGDIYRDANEGRQFDFVYAAMLVFGSLIALLGLLLNSPAVIIGAMLISPLMGPLLACGLALTLADSHIGAKAGRNLALSIIETVVIAAFATWLSPLREITPEIAARTNPNLMDLLIALFSGAAGTLALCSKRQAFTILPGVAIATAVAPPLATIGYALSTRQVDVARGAAMLFVTNMTAIVLSSAVVFTLVGFRVREHLAEKSPGLIRWRLPIAALAVLGLAVPLVQTLKNAATQTQLNHKARTEFERLSRKDLDASPSFVKIGSRDGRPTIRAIVPTRHYIPADKLHTIQSELQKSLGREIELHVEQVQLAESSAKEANRDYVAGGAIKPYNTTPDSPVKPQDLRKEIEARFCAALENGNVSRCEVQSVEVTEKHLHASIKLDSTQPLTSNLLAYASGYAAATVSEPLECVVSTDIVTGSTPVFLGEQFSALSPETRKALLKLKPYLQDPTVSAVLSGTDVGTKDARALAALLGISESRVIVQADEKRRTVSLSQRLDANPPPVEESPRTTSPSTSD